MKQYQTRETKFKKTKFLKAIFFSNQKLDRITFAYSLKKKTFDSNSYECRTSKRTFRACHYFCVYSKYSN